MGRKKGVILSYVLMVFEVFSTLLLTPFIMRSLGGAEYGVYKLVVSITGYLMLLDLGIGNSVVKYVAKYKENNDIDGNRKFLGISTLFYSGIALLSLVAGLILIYVFPSAFAYGLSQEEINVSIKLLYITVLNTMVTLGTSGFGNTIIGYSKFDVSKGMSILQICLKILLTYIALRLGFKSVAIVTIQLITTVMCRGFYVIYVLYVLKLKPMFKNPDWAFIKEVVVYSGFILLQMVATQINVGAGQIILGIMVPGAAVLIGIYGVGTQLVQYFQSIGSVFNGVLMPGVVKMVENDATSIQLQDEMTRIGRISLMVLAIIWGGFVVFGRQFVLLWAGGDYLDAFYVAAALMTVHLIIYPECIGYQILWAKNENKELSFMKFSIVIINVVVTVLLVKINPLVGATVGTFASLLAGDVIVMNFLFKKKIGIKLGKYYYQMCKGIIPALFIACISGVLFNLMNLSGWIWLAAGIITMCSVYALCMLFFGFNKYEKQLMLSMLGKLKFIKGRSTNV